MSIELTKEEALAIYVWLEKEHPMDMISTLFSTPHNMAIKSLRNKLREYLTTGAQ